MSIQRLKLNIDNAVARWYEQLFIDLPQNDFIIICNNSDWLRWFGTNLTQYLCTIGGHEVVPMYGKQINNLESCCYQINLSMPIGYNFRPDYHALYDTLLNFETEPPKRVIVFNDAQFLLSSNPEVFDNVMESMVVASYVNREGISTIKEDGTRYKVDQRNIFIFDNANWERIGESINREFYIPSIDEHTRVDRKLDFNIIEIVDESEQAL
ncbi:MULTISPECIES: hypothetical protein [Niastella]|uniref:Barstar (barnase inhibitor) domain-containing protein n=1 Tax=Niastella soli TaxID=2821487 RepID=A0ABS3Z2L4_9BACT|nr:hypothetical protein [Niastella soli]MBO9204406.1 hypothetical protein [Niastella soli]